MDELLRIYHSWMNPPRASRKKEQARERLEKAAGGPEDFTKTTIVRPVLSPRPKTKLISSIFWCGFAFVIGFWIYPTSSPLERKTTSAHAVQQRNYDLEHRVGATPTPGADFNVGVQDAQRLKVNVDILGAQRLKVNIHSLGGGGGGLQQQPKLYVRSPGGPPPEASNASVDLLGGIQQPKVDVDLRSAHRPLKKVNVEPRGAQKPRAVKARVGGGAEFGAYGDPRLNEDPTDVRATFATKGGGGEAAESGEEGEWRNVGYSWDLHPIEGWRTPACKGIVIPPTKTKSQQKPIRTLEDLKRPGQRVLVLVPRFGLGNCLRSFMSAFYFSLVTGRRLVLLHAGRHAGVYDSLCRAFHCSYDHIRPQGKETPSALEERFNVEVTHVNLERTYLTNYSLWHDSQAEVFFRASNQLWDGWFKSKKTLQNCIYRALQCVSVWCARSRALNGLLRLGPTKDLRITIHDILWKHTDNNTRARGMAIQVGADFRSAFSAKFDVAIHVRTRDKGMEAGGKACSDYGTRDKEKACKKERKDYAKRMALRFLKAEVWECVDELLVNISRGNGSVAGEDLVRGTGKPTGSRQLSIFVATDSRSLRPEIVRRLGRHGAVFYSRAEPAHLATAAKDEKGRLATMAEFFLFSKARVMVELDSYLSTFAQVAGEIGNSTVVSIPLDATQRNSTRRCTISFHNRRVWRPPPPSQQHAAANT